MEKYSKEIIGAWLAAIGTITSAIGSTPFHSISSDLRDSLDLWGNTLQATGNALEVDGQGGISLEAIGNELQSIGNSTVIAGLTIDSETVIEQKLIISGNWMQALGGLVNVADEFKDNTHAGMLENIIGNLLQAIGNSLQAIGGIRNLEQDENAEGDENDKEEDGNEEENSAGQTLIVSGSWIQAVGSVISLIGQIKEEAQEEQQAEVKEDQEEQSGNEEEYRF